MLKQRGIKAVIISLLVILSSTCFSLVLFNGIYEHNKTQIKNHVSAFSGGSGTETDPYKISSTADLNELAEGTEGRTAYTNVYFKLTNDIDFQNGTFQCIGWGRNTKTDGSAFPVHRFNGIFDGDGYCIKNAKLTGSFHRHWNESISNKKNRGIHHHYTGLFINLGEHSNIKNLKI